MAHTFFSEHCFFIFIRQKKTFQNLHWNYPMLSISKKLDCLLNVWSLEFTCYSILLQRCFYNKKSVLPVWNKINDITMATKRPHWLVQRSANYSITSFVNNKNQLSPYRSYLQQNKHYWIYQRQYSAKVMQEYTFIVIEHEENFPLSRWLFPIISSFCTNCLARKTGETPDAMFNIESFVSLSNTYVLRNQRIYKHSTYYNE